jgi:hypothetical protein
MDAVGKSVGMPAGSGQDERDELASRWMAAMGALRERDPIEFERVLDELERLVRSRVR